jgi:hypothetical protein
VPRDEVPEQCLHVGRGAPRQQQVAEEQQDRRARWEASAVLAPTGPALVRDQERGEGQEEGERWKRGIGPENGQRS